MNATGSALVYSTFVGQAGNENGFAIAVDPAGSAVAVGSVAEGSGPMAPTDALITQLNPTGTSVVYSLLLGGAAGETGRDVALDAQRNAYVVGDTGSADFPATPGAFATVLAGSTDAFIAKIAGAPVPATLMLDPAAATNPVRTKHCVTATVSDAGGAPVPDVTVRFTVIGSVNTSGAAVTDNSGAAEFCYAGPLLQPGTDALSAFADTNDDGLQDPSEPSAGAGKVWVLPASTPGCKVGDAGVITAANGHHALFSGFASSGTG